jgi:MFS family permease
LNSASYTGSALVGPALAGALLGPLGAGTLFFINGVSFLAVIFALFAMRDVPTHAGGHPGRLGASILSGLKFAWEDRRLLVLLALSALAGVFGRSYQNLLPIFARDIWHGGPEAYGLLLSAAGAGAIVGAFGLASFKKVNYPERIMIVSGLLFSLMILSFAISPSLLPGALFLFVSGVLVTVFGTIIATFIQIASPKEIRGRVMSLYSITLIGLPSLGALGSGALAQYLGGVSGAPRAVLLGALILGVLLLAVTPFFWRRKMVQVEA